jgi:hypothetical protein
VRVRSATGWNRNGDGWRGERDGLEGKSGSPLYLQRFAEIAVS